MSKGSSGSTSSSASGSASGGSASSTASKIAQSYAAPVNTLSSADVRQRESDALGNLNSLNNIANQGLNNRELQSSRVAQEIENNRAIRNRNEANNNFGRSLGGGSTSASAGQDNSRERERQFQREMMQTSLNNRIQETAANRYQNDISNAMQFSNQANSELRQGKNARELATIDANARMGAAALQAQGNVLGSLFGSLGGSAGSQNYRYWG